MRTFLLTIGLLAMAVPALACDMSKTSAQSGQQTPLPVASSDQSPSTPAAPTAKPQS